MLLNEVLRKGMSPETQTKGFGMADSLSENTKNELRAIIEESLEKAGLMELSGRLRGLG